MTDGMLDLPEFEPGKNYGFTAAGGWCAPSDTIYEFMRGDAFTPREPDCPDWMAMGEPCKARAWEQDHYGEYYEVDSVDRGWHDCKHEYTGPHLVCECSDCGARRVIVQEKKGEPWTLSNGQT